MSRRTYPSGMQPFTHLLTRYHGITSNICSIFPNIWSPPLATSIFHQVTAICASKSFRVRSTRRLAMAATASGLTSGPWPTAPAWGRSVRSLRGATKCSFCVRRSCNLALAFPSFLAEVSFLGLKLFKTLFWGGRCKSWLSRIYDYSYNSTTLFFGDIHKWIIVINRELKSW